MMELHLKYMSHSLCSSLQYQLLLTITENAFNTLISLRYQIEKHFDSQYAKYQPTGTVF